MSPDAVDREIADHCRVFQKLKGVGRQRAVTAAKPEKMNAGATIAPPYWHHGTAYAHGLPEGS